jgi:hypothetical protein
LLAPRPFRPAIVRHVDDAIDGQIEKALLDELLDRQRRLEQPGRLAAGAHLRIDQEVIENIVRGQELRAGRDGRVWPLPQKIGDERIAALLAKIVLDRCTAANQAFCGYWACRAPLAASVPSSVGAGVASITRVAPSILYRCATSSALAMRVSARYRPGSPAEPRASARALLLRASSRLQ